MEQKERRVAGIDVHKSMLAVVVRREKDGKAEYNSRNFGATTAEIAHLAAWLSSEGATEVAMESTAQYWRPVWHGLEAHFKLHLCHPLKVKAPRGRKHDFGDARRLADRWWSGDLEDSFVPGAEQRQWRLMTRTRVQIKRKKGVVRNQVEGLLEHGGIKLSAVASDLFGASGLAMLKLVADGKTDPEVLLGAARGQLRKKAAQLREALAGGLDEYGRMLLRQGLEQVEQLRKHLAEINTALAKAMAPYTATLLRLSKVPGVNLYAAQELVAEIGPAAASFASPEQFTSWAGICPGRQESAGVNHSTRSPKGSPHLKRLFNQIAWAAIHTKDCFFAALYGKLKARKDNKEKKAAWAVAHRIARLVWLMLHEGVEYHEKGPSPLDPRKLARKMRRAIRDCVRGGLDPMQFMDPLPGAVGG